jgi:hypothetical protein
MSHRLRLVSAHLYGLMDNALEDARVISFKTQRYLSHRLWHYHCIEIVEDVRLNQAQFRQM